MSASNPFGDLHPPKELPNVALYAQWFKVADTDNDGRLSGPDAVKFFERSGLSREQLAKVWALSDQARRGYLDKKNFSQAMNLISLAQNTGEVNMEMLKKYESQMEAPAMSGLGKLLEKLHVEDSDTFDEGGGGSGFPSPDHTFRKTQSSNLVSPPRLQQSSSMFSRSNTTAKTARSMSMKDVTSIVDGLRQIYFSKIRPLEEQFKFGAFFSSLLNESDFYAKPSVLLLGQYSTGKTTFIKHLLQREYPGIHIGPEPTTDRFVVVMHGVEERRTPGNTLVVQPDKPYQGASMFGNGFLSKLEAASCPSALLEEITIVDTPGVLSGEKQRIERTYNFIDVCGWFAQRCDMILLLFDPHKLDISDEFKQVIGTLKGHDDKVRVVLNKSDQVDQQQLMRVYGALMWSLSKVFRSPEVCKVYIGSFNSEAPIRTDINPYGKDMFEKEQAALLADLYEIPQRSCDRKVNEFVKRVRAAKIHFLICGHLKKQMPMMGKAKAQERLLKNLGDVFAQVQREYHLPAGDFPDVNRYREILSAYDLSTFPKLKDSMIKTIEDSLSVDIPALVRRFDNPYN